MDAVWILLETAVCLTDSLLLYMLIRKYADIRFRLRDMLPVLAAAGLSFLRVHFGMSRLISPIPALAVGWCVCMYFGLRPLGSLITAMLYFVFTEISELFIMGIFTLLLGEHYAELSYLPLFNLAGIVLSRCVFIYIINSRPIKMQMTVPPGYNMLLAAAVFMITLCMECLCITAADMDMSTRLVFTFISMVMFAIILLVLLLFNRLAHYYTGYYENREIANSLRMTEELYKAMAAGSEQERRAVHDCKNHIFTALELLKQNKVQEAEAYLQSVSGTLERPYKNWLHNNIADIVITKKAETAEALGVKLSVTGVMGEVDISSTDMSSLMSNLLDNAIEAAAGCSGGFVRLKVKMQGDYICISTVNPAAQMPRMTGGNFLTTKPDKTKHGMGIKIIKDIVKRYNGEFDLDTEDGYVKVCVLLRPCSTDFVPDLCKLGED